MKKLITLIAVFALFVGCKKKEEEKKEVKAPKKVASKKVVKKVVAKKGNPAAKKVAVKAVAKIKVAALEAGFKKIPNINGFSVKVPANAKPNGIGGAAGFHTADDSFSFVLMEIKVPKEMKKTMKDAKKDASAYFFKKWVSSKATKDGWILVYHSQKLKDGKPVGTLYSFEVRRKLNNKIYKCYGSIKNEKGIADCLTACNSIK
jgi:hypothetical protein